MECLYLTGKPIRLTQGRELCRTAPAVAVELHNFEAEKEIGGGVVIYKIRVWSHGK